MDGQGAASSGASGGGFWRRYLPVTLTVCVGTAVSIAMFIIVHGWERERTRLDFEKNVMQLAVPIQRSIDESSEVLHAIHSFYEAAGTVTRRQFGAFVRREVSEHTSIQALEWIPRVRHVERAVYEAAARRDGYLNFQISERKTQGRMVRAAKRAEYFPVYYVEPYKGNEVALGFDLASNPARLAALERARDTGAPTATPGIVLVQETGKQSGFLIFVSIYRSGSSLETVEERRRNLLGFALGVFRIGDLVEASLRGLDVAGIDITIYDETAPAPQRLLLHHAESGPALTVQTAEGEGSKGLAGLSWEKSFDVGARQWSVLFMATPQYLAAHRSWQPWGVLVACLLLTTILAAYLSVSIGRTHLLGQAKESLEREFSARIQAEKGLIKRTQQLEELRTVTVEITRELDLPSLLGVITRRVTELIGADLGAISLWDEAAQVLVSRAWHGYESWLGEVRYKLGEGLTGTVAKRREAVIVNDYPNSPFAHPLFVERANIKAAVGQPLLYRDHLLGVIHVANVGNHRPFTEREATLLSLFATQAAIAIENARLHAGTVKRSEELQALLRSTRTIMGGLDLRGTLDRIIQEAAQISGIRHVKVVLVDKEAGAVRVAAAVGRPAEMFEGFAVPLGTGTSGLVAATGEPLFIADCQNDPRNQLFWDQDRKLGIHTYLGLPIKIRDEVLGVLTFNTIEPHEYSPEELAYLAAFADQAAIALENARLHDATVQQLADLKALHDMGRAIASGMTLEEQLEILIERLGRTAGAQRVLVGLLDSADANRFRLCLAYDASKPEPWLRNLDLSWDKYPEIQEAVRTGRLLVIPDIFADPFLAPVQEHLKRVGLRSLVVIPLVVQGKTIGVVSLGYLGQSRTVTDEELGRFQSFAAQGAIAIQQARLYDEVRRSAILLEAKVEDRTRELRVANLKLQEATRQAEEASRHKSEFLANMSHEIRTPLNAVIGFSDLLREQRVGPLNEKQLRYISHIWNGGKHLLQLISDILDLSKVEAGKFILKPEPLLVTQTLEDILVIARGLTNKKEQDLQTDIASDLPPLTADHVRFKQILFNLLSNAIKFTPDGGRITLTARRVDWSNGQVVDSSRPIDQLTTRPIDSARDWLEVAVRDTGVGIKPEDMSRLFQEFVQLETTQAQRHEGSGLGLALSKRLVELHGGRIWAESEGEGRGSTFTIVLPFSGPET